MKDVCSVAFSPNGKTIASASRDGTSRIWNVGTGTSISLFAFDSGDWFISDDSGRFDCSSGGRKYVGLVKGLTYYEPEQFWSSFYTPGLMDRFMKGEAACSP